MLLPNAYPFTKNTEEIWDLEYEKIAKNGR